MRLVDWVAFVAIRTHSASSRAPTPLERAYSTAVWRARSARRERLNTEKRSHGDSLEARMNVPSLTSHAEPKHFSQRCTVRPPSPPFSLPPRREIEAEHAMR